MTKNEFQKVINDLITLEARFNLIFETRSVVKVLSSLELIRMFFDENRDVVVAETFTQCKNYNIESNYIFEIENLKLIKAVLLGEEYYWGNEAYEKRVK